MFYWFGKLIKGQKYINNLFDPMASEKVLSRDGKICKRGCSSIDFIKF